MLNGNWVDLIILVILAFYILEGLERGFWVLVAELAGFLGSIAAALRFYPLVAKLLIDNFNLPHSLANALGFLAAAVASEMAISYLIVKIIWPRIPRRFLETPIQKFLGIIPSLFNGLILIAFFLTLFLALPLNPQIKADINNSKVGGYLVDRTVGLERKLADIFGGAIRDSLTYFTVEPKSNERVSLTNLTPAKLTIDTQAETQLFALVNKERRDRGIAELVWDPQIVEVARKHSRDMWERHYFAHVDPDGKDPGDRLKAGGISFTLAGENLALAPTTQMAHQGLMNSEGHRRNILDPDFKKIGIGVIDGGVYGKMFTQNFTD
ncbi:CvpA family protein [Candidatus Microgenomates bacterium]|nr:CvpA family protein [Candidatus Microgenomates bacterium]